MGFSGIYNFDSLTGIRVAGNEGMEMKMDITITGYIRTIIIIGMKMNSFIPNEPNAGQHTSSLQFGIPPKNPPNAETL